MGGGGKDQTKDLKEAFSKKPESKSPF